jgi:hypothetical protein
MGMIANFRRIRIRDDQLNFSTYEGCLEAVTDLGLRLRSCPTGVPDD